MSDDANKDKKPATQTCRNLPAAAKRVVSLAIHIPGATHASVTKALADQKLQLEIANELQKAGQELMKQQSAAVGKSITAGASLSKLGGAAQKKLNDPVVKQLQKTEEYKKLERGLQEFKCAFDDTPVGVFFNENKGLLIILGAVGAIGSGVAMYYTRAGDIPAKGFSLLPLLAPIKLGTVELIASGVNFKPSERKFDATVGASVEWKGVKASLELSASFKNDQLVGGGGKANVSLTVNSKTTAFIKGGWTSSQSNDNAPDKPEKIKGSAELGVKRKVSDRVNLQVQLFGEFEQNEKARKSQVGVSGKYELAKPAGPKSSLALDFSVGSGKYQHPNGNSYTQPQDNHQVKLGVTFIFE